MVMLACIMCIVRILSIQIPGKSRVIFGVTPTPGPLPPRLDNDQSFSWQSPIGGKNLKV
jgi:hypothetical protein